MKRMKKLFAILMTMAMVMGLGITGFAADGVPESSDTASVSITNIKTGATVTLYQVAKVRYGNGGKQGFLDYEWANGCEITETAPTTDQINTIAQGIKNETITPWATINDGTVSDGIYTATVSGGAYIALITQAEDGTVYNPILLTATYGESGNLSGGNIDSTSYYLYGSTAVAKSTTPTIDKVITGGSTDDEGKDTASVGDVITYTVTPTVPSYPSNATNKTFFISDTMTDGLTFDYSSLTVNITGQKVTRDGNNFKLNEKVIATAYETAKGFNLNFDYDSLISDTTTGAVYQPIVTYKAVVNEKAVVGGSGNTNSAELYYANDPNAGSTWEPVNTTPENADDVDSDTDTETVYTYQLGFRKSDDNTTGTPIYLEGAVFGIYKDQGCTQLIDKVTTNEDGYAVSTNVAAGTYYVKELVAPTGYTLNETVYSIRADWTTVTTTITGTVTDSTYTSNKPSDDAVQVGWIKNGVFYALDEVKKENAETNGYAVAYLASETTTDITPEKVTKTNQGAGTAFLENNITNIKISALPSTGGMGTTIFTIAGCVIMISAAGLFFESRRKAN